MTYSTEIDEISLDLLHSGDEEEADRLLEACIRDGVFYLNLRQQDDERIESPLIRYADHIFDASKSLFDLPLEKKMKYDIDRNGDLKLNGYKPLGRNRAGLRGGKDGFESYAISKDFIFSLDSPAGREVHPEVMDSNLSLLQAFTTEITAATNTILSCLSTALGMPVGKGLEAHHRPLAPSPDMLRLLRYAPQPADERGAPQVAHTDLGSLTILFAGSPGLQRWSPHTRNGADQSDEDEVQWEFIMPREGCAVVNVGDGLVALTGGLLSSCLHRVVPPPGKGMGERYSFAWMSRAEEETVMTALRGDRVPLCDHAEREPVTSGQWLRRKFVMLRK